MICVPYFEKALYELPESELTVEGIQKLADRIEVCLEGIFLQFSSELFPIPTGILFL
jgi:hypothetical protein